MWGERGVAGFFEDIHVLIVVVLGMSILLGSLAAAYVAHEGAVESSALRAEASRLLRTVLEDPSLVHIGQRGLLDVIAIERLNSTSLAEIVRTGRPVQLVISERSGDAPRTFLLETAPQGHHRVSAATATGVWHSDLDVRAARVTLTLSGSA